MTDAKRDRNSVPTMLALSLLDGTTPVPLYADPTTHRLLVSGYGNTFVTVGDADADFITGSYASDDLAIQAAIDSIPNGGIVFIKAGTYSIENNLNVKSNIVLMGEGYATRLDIAINKSVIVSEKTNVRIRDIYFDGTNHIFNNFGILITKSTDVTVEDCYVLNFGGFAMFIVSSGTSEYGKIRVHQNRLSSSTGDNDVIGGGADDTSVLSELMITDNYIKQIAGSDHNAIAIVAVNKTLIQGNITQGSIILSGEKIPHIHVTIADNIIRPSFGLDYCQIAILTNSNAGQTAHSKYININNNQLIEGHILVQGQSSTSSPTEKVIVSNNNIETSTTVVNPEFTYGITLGNLSNVTVVANTIENAARAINYSDTNGILITNNTFENCTLGITSSGSNTGQVIFNNPGNTGDDIISPNSLSVSNPGAGDALGFIVQREGVSPYSLVVDTANTRIGARVSSPNATLHLGGSVQFLRRSTAINTSIDSYDDYYIGVTDTSVARTITLPSSVTAGSGKIFLIKDESGAASVNNITITTVSGQTIDGGASYVVNTNNGCVSVMSDGANWKIIHKF